MGDYTARIRRAVARGPATRSLFLERPAGLDFVPGQFLSLKLAHDGQPVTRPYTIASDPEDPSELELLFDRVPGGVASEQLWSLPVAGEVAFSGPWGTFTLARAPDAETVFIAEETGIAAIRPMVRRAVRSAVHPVHLLYAADQPLYLDELGALPGVALATVPRGELLSATRARWVDADALRERAFFCCGIGKTVLAVRDLLRGSGYARRAVQYERW